MTATVAQFSAALADNITLTVSAGSTLHVWFSYSSASSAGITCSDNNGGSYGSLLDAQDNRGGNSLGQFRSVNHASGSTTITIGNHPGGSAYIAVVEITGVATSPADGTSSNFQAGLGGGTNNATSGNITPSNQPGIIIGLSVGSDFGFDGTDANLGTGFTNVGTCWQVFANDAARVAYKAVTSTSAQAATFNWQSFGNDAITFGAIYDEPGGGGSLVSIPTYSSYITA